MRQTVCLLYSPFRLLFVVILSPVITLGYWALSTLFFPFYIFQTLVSFFAHLLDSDLCKIVNSTGHIICRDHEDWLKSPSQTIAVILKLSGSPTLSEVHQMFLKKWIYRYTDVNHCHLEYPELQQYIAKRMGYLFFKWDRTFDIGSHVQIFSNKELLPNPKTDIVDDMTLMKIWEVILQKPFMEKRSPWDGYLIPNYVPDNQENAEGKQSIFILRLHHGLCDGISIYKLLLALTDDGLTNLEKDVPVFRKAPFGRDLYIHLKAFLCGPTGTLLKMSHGFDIFNPLHLPLGKKTGKIHIVTTTIDLEIVKKVSSLHLDVSIHAVLMAALTGGIRNYLLENGHKIPLLPIKVGVPIPKPGHSHKLRNDYFVSTLDLPVHKKTPRQRLFALEQSLNEMASESFMPFMAQTWQILGLFPTKMLKFLTLKSAVSILYSEMKGPTKKLSIMDGKHELYSLLYSFGLGIDDLGVAFTSISYKGRVELVLIIDHSISKTRDKAQHFLNLIVKELDELQYGDSTNL